MFKVAGFLGSVILFILIISGMVWFTSSDVNDAPNVDNLVELRRDQDAYIRCYNSINYGSSLISDVRLEHITFGMSEEAIARLDKLEADFTAQIKKDCEPKVKKYETVFNSVPSDDPTHNLSYIRLRAGNPLTYLSFTKEDVEKYFDEN